MCSRSARLFTREKALFPYLLTNRRRIGPLPQVLGMLGSVAGKRVVELGAGIGRFTGELARNAAHVLAVDFMENLIAQNREDNAHCSNVEWRQADATQLTVMLAPM